MITRAPSIDRLIDFEAASWPEHQQASVEDLRSRLDLFAEGVFLLSEEHVDVAQVTVSPKRVILDEVRSFETMRDLPVVPESRSLWVTNVAVRAGAVFRGKGHSRALLTEVARWAKERGYAIIAAGVTCSGYARLLRSGEVSSIEDYLRQDRNPALRTFRSAARVNGCRFWHSRAIAGYWDADEDSAGYGVLAVIECEERSAYEAPAREQRSWDRAP